MLIGYIRVSTNDQNTDLQRNALNCAGCELIFEDKISGTKSESLGLTLLFLMQIKGFFKQALETKEAFLNHN